METPDIILFGGPAYHDPRNSVEQQMARSLARLGCRVLYVETKTAPGPRRETLDAGTIELVSPAWTPLLPVTLPGWNRRWNMIRSRRLIRRSLARFEFRNPLMLHYSWYSQELVGCLGQRLDVVECIDADEERPQILRLPGLRRYVRRTEAALLSRADALVVTSPALLEGRSNRVRRSQVLLNGVDPAPFAGEFPEPDFLRDVPHPRALVSGVLGPKIDLDLVEGAVGQIPELQVVVAGPLRQAGRGLHPRMHPVGALPYRELAAVMSHCDLGLVPLTETRYNRASCPLKVLEYLAAGLAVVSVPNPAVEVWAGEHPELITIAATRDRFAPAIRRGLEGLGPPRKRQAREAAARHSWDQRARRLLEFLSGVPPRRSRGIRLDG